MGISATVVRLMFILVVISYEAAAKEGNETNKMCPKNTAMNDALRMTLLNAHNKYRSSLARGKEPDPLIGFAPKASKMLKMVYDCEVEASAIEHGQRCVFRHYPSRFGENLFSISSKDRMRAATKAPGAWWKELKKYGIGSDVKLTSKVYSKGIGHYSQMAWESSYRLGCAVTKCPKFTSVLCQYGPRGNVIGRKIYTVGKPCKSNADCPGKYTCSVAEGLCNVVK